MSTTVIAQVQDGNSKERSFELRTVIQESRDESNQTDRRDTQDPLQFGHKRLCVMRPLVVKHNALDCGL